MTTSHEIASALGRAHETAKNYGGSILPSSEIQRADRELLTRTHWLQEIIKGWYMLVRPDLNIGESSGWYANFWDFLRIYLEHLYDKDYCLSAVSPGVL